MKRLIAAAILTVLVASLWFCGNYTIKHHTEKTKASLESCMQELKDGNEQKAREKAEKLEIQWDKSKMWLAVFVNHTLLDSISKSVSHLSSMASGKEFAHFESEYSEITGTLEQIVAENRFEISAFY